MRVDVNLSVRKQGSNVLGTRTEMKNLGSFRAISKAIEAEAKRQIGILEAGGEIVMETRRWDEKEEQSFSMRSKEDVRDYRYFPEPDLPPVVILGEWIGNIRNRQPELAHEKKDRYIKEYGLPVYDAGILTEDKVLADFFEQTVKLCHQPKKVSNWLMGETLRLLKEENRATKELRFSPETLAELIMLVDRGTINGTVAKQVFEKMFYENVQPKAYVETKSLGMVNDDVLLESVVREVVAENPQSVADYHAGKIRALGFLTGQVMRKLKGRANAEKVSEILCKIV